MKKLLLLLFVGALGFTSCELPIKPVDDPKHSTNVTLLEAVKDTVPVLIQDNIIYVFNEDGHVEYKVTQYDPSDTFGGGVIMCFIMCVIFLIFIMFNN